MITAGIVADWDAVAGAWDASVSYVDDHSADATAALLAAVAPHPGDRVLELAAGPGTLAPAWAAAVGAAGTVVLTDIAPRMVEAAAQRNAAVANVSCQVMDAASIAFPDGSFEAVASRMGLMFVADPALALAETRRVLVPGGRFGALTWAGPEHNPWMSCVGMAAAAAGVVSGGPPVGPGGIFSLSDPAILRDLVAGAGFADVTVSEFAITFNAPDVDAHVDRVMSLAAPMAAAFDAAPADQQAEVRRIAASLAAPHTDATGVHLPGRVLLVSGRR